MGRLLKEKDGKYKMWSTIIDSYLTKKYYPHQEDKHKQHYDLLDNYKEKYIFFLEEINKIGISLRVKTKNQDVDFYTEDMA